MEDKVQYSIAQIRKAEKLALAMQPDGLWVGFSGGKDSQVLLELVKMAGVKYRAVYNVTTNDPPENVYFIRNNYPEVEFNIPKNNFYKIVERKGLPTRLRRFCCDELKESGGIVYVVLTGVRSEESVTRKGYDEVAIYSKRKEHKGRKKHTLEQIIENEHRCIKGKDKVMVYPILGWTEEDVWQFHRERNLPRNICYDISGRVGCMFCPYSSKREIEYYEKQYPLFKRNLLIHFSRFLAKRRKKEFETVEEYYEWWKSKESVKDFKAKRQQTSMSFE